MPWRSEHSLPNGHTRRVLSCNIVFSTYESFVLTHDICMGIAYRLLLQANFTTHSVLVCKQFRSVKLNS